MLVESQKLREVVQNPVISTAEQSAAMSFLLKRIKVGEWVQKFVSVLIQNGRLNILSEAVDSYFTLLKEHNGEIDAEVITAVPLNDNNISDLQKSLSASLGKKVQVNQKIDKEILGGVIIKIGSKMLDASVSGGLRKLEKTIKEAIAS
jgi:F-type H+-transporting ATPase subunit delta